MTPILKQRLADLVAASIETHQGIISQQTLFADLLAGLDTWNSLELARDACWKIAAQAVTKYARADTGQLDLPGLEALKPTVAIGGNVITTRHVTLGQYRLMLQRLKLRIESYDYARRSEQALKRDKKAYREMRKFEPVFARLSASNEQLELWQASELHELEQEKPARKQRKTAIKARWSRTKNQ